MARRSFLTLSGVATVGLSGWFTGGAVANQTQSTDSGYGATGYGETTYGSV